MSSEASHLSSSEATWMLADDLPEVECHIDDSLAVEGPAYRKRAVVVAVRIGSLAVPSTVMAWTLSLLAHAALAGIALWVINGHHYTLPRVTFMQGSGAPEGGLYPSAEVSGFNELGIGLPASAGWSGDAPNPPPLAPLLDAKQDAAEEGNTGTVASAWPEPTGFVFDTMPPPADGQPPVMKLIPATPLVAPRRPPRLPAHLLPGPMLSAAGGPHQGSRSEAGGRVGDSGSEVSPNGSGTSAQQAGIASGEVPSSFDGEGLEDGSDLPGGGKGGVPAGIAAGGLSAPKYPRESRRRGEQGRVLLEVQVRPDGSVGKVRVLETPGYSRLTEAAITAVREAKFVPAIRDGEPVESVVHIPFHFSLQTSK